MSTMVLLKCECCSREFDYSKKEYNRQTKKYGRDKFFCSRSCATKWNNSHRSEETTSKIAKAVGDRSKNNEYAKKGNFTWALRQIEKRKKWSTDIDEAYLQEVWNTQKGICPYSGLKMTMKRGKNTPITASIDRIDSDKGYIKGNVQFVCYSMNLAKWTFTHEEMKSFVSELRESTPRA